MKKTLAFIVLVALIVNCGSIFRYSVDYTRSEQVDYTRIVQKQLTIEIEKSIITTSSDWDAFLSKSRRLGRAGLLIKESKKWDCYQGGIKIPEWKFYEIAGFHEYAEKAKSYKSRRDLFTHGARACIFVGSGMWFVDFLVALSKFETYEPGTLTWVALGFAYV